jgi:effector-binding domain-containing protein
MCIGICRAAYLLPLMLLVTPAAAQTPAVTTPLPAISAPAPSVAPGGVARPGVVESSPLAPLPGTSAPQQTPVTQAPVAPDPASPTPPVVVQQPAPVAPLGQVAPAPSQTVPAPPAPAQPVQAQPVPSSPAAPAPGGVTSPPAIAQPAPSVPGALNPRATLVPVPGDPANVDDVMLTEKPVAIIAGIAIWTEGYPRLADAAKRLEEALAKAGVRVAGRPLSRFVESDDLGFRYEMMVPIEAAPVDRSGLPAEIRFGNSPGGRATRFSHKGAYDEIDGTYEAITAYLDAKGVTVNDSFIEEYVTDFSNPSDSSADINIFVMPK